MRVFAFIAGLLFLCTAQSSFAEDAKKADSAAPGSSIEMPYLIAPLSDADGSLVAYAYISCKITAANPTAALAVRDKIPFIQDAFVRDVNRLAISSPDTPMTIDQTALAARMLSLTRKVAGAANVLDLKLTQVQISPMRPGPVPPGSPS